MEVFDATYAGQQGFDELGQFVSRYYLSGLIAHQHGAWLDLHGGAPEWKVYADTMTEVLRRLQDH